MEVTETAPVEESMESLLTKLEAPQPEAEAPKPEAVKEPEVAKEPPKDPLGSKFLELARKERAHQLAVESFRKESDGFKAFQNAKLNAQSNPLAVFDSLGLDIEKVYDVLTNHILDGKNPANAKFRELESSLQKLQREKEEETKKAQALAAQAAQSQARQKVKDDVVALGDECELINIYGRHDLVCDEIIRHYKETNEEISIKAAAEKIEKLLEAELRKAEQSKKFKSLHKSPTPTLELSQPKTLSNSASNGTTRPPEEIPPDQEMAYLAKMLQQ